MEREELKEQFKKLLNGKSEHLKCEIILPNENPIIVGVFQNEENDINFYIENDCVVNFDDVDIISLQIIFDELNK